MYVYNLPSDLLIKQNCTDLCKIINESGRVCKLIHVVSTKYFKPNDNRMREITGEY
jgi:hypothetical protein